MSQSLANPVPGREFLAVRHPSREAGRGGERERLPKRPSAANCAYINLSPRCPSSDCMVGLAASRSVPDPSTE